MIKILITNLFLFQESKQFMGHIHLSWEMSTILVTNRFIIRKWTILVTYLFGTRNMKNSYNKYICNKKCSQFWWQICLLQESKQFLWRIYLSWEILTVLVTNIFVIRKRTILVTYVFGTRNMNNSSDKYIWYKKVNNSYDMFICHEKCVLF